jgi:SAM-dependent methyltransferase
MRIFRPGPGPYANPLAISGVKLGERLLQIGGSDAGLFAKLASKVGFTGKASAIVRNQEEASNLLEATRREGVLVAAEIEVAPLHELPYEASSFDLVFVDGGNLLAYLEPGLRAVLLSEVLRVLRPGGRLIVMERYRRRGLGALWPVNAELKAYSSSGGALQALQDRQFHPARIVAEIEGMRFVEGLRPKSS